MKHKLIQNSLLLFTMMYLLSCSSEQSKEVNDHSKDSTSHDTSAPAAKTSARPVHWGYEGQDGPDHWAELSPAYAICASGKNQSPINIEKMNVTTGASWKLNYQNSSLRIAHNEHMNEIIDNGHTIQVTVDPGSRFTFENKTYNLKQFHFHTPSEHMIDGKNLPMEMHLVHQATDESLAVIAVLFKEGKKANENLNQLITHLPSAKGESKHLQNDSINIELHVPSDNHAYHYIGSLTTPPCSENVQWLVLREMITVTADQVKAFSSRIGHSNRPVQGLNGREVKLDELKTRIE